jgi:hypothetical protein
VGDLRRTWAAKAGDPALAPYLTLIDPERRVGPDGDPPEDADAGASHPAAEVGARG